MNLFIPALNTKMERDTMHKDGTKAMFSVSVYKPQGRKAYVSAVEGWSNRELGTFSTMLFDDSCRRYRIELDGNNTAKNRAVAMGRLKAILIEAGAIDASGADILKAV